MAVTAGMDMDMGTWIYSHKLKEAVQNGRADVSDIDDAVRRILSVKMRLGLFDHPYVTEEQMHRYDRLPEEHVAHALETAEKSIVLLKNEGVLPLKKTVKISLVGALADMPEEEINEEQLLNQLGDDLVAAGEHYLVTKSRSGSQYPFKRHGRG